MGASVQEYLLHAGIGQELESIFDERGIGKRKKTLSSSNKSQPTSVLQSVRHNISSCSTTAYPRPVESKGLESRLKCIREHHSLQSLLYLLSLITLRFGTASLLLGTHYWRILRSVSRLIRQNQWLSRRAGGLSRRGNNHRSTVPKNTMDHRMVIDQNNGVQGPFAAGPWEARYQRKAQKTPPSLR